jgi:hypothetical protein
MNRLKEMRHKLIKHLECVKVKSTGDTRKKKKKIVLTETLFFE